MLLSASFSAVTGKAATQYWTAEALNIAQQPLVCWK